MLSVIVMLFAFSFTSCKKNYSCSCKWTYSSVYDDGNFTYSFDDSGTKTFDLGKIKKSDAAKACDDKAAQVWTLEGLETKSTEEETISAVADCTESKK